MSIGDGNTCSLDNPLAASTNHWVRQHASPAVSQVPCTESRTHFMEPRPEQPDPQAPKSNQASANNPLARHRPAHPPAVTTPLTPDQSAELDPKSNQASPNPLAQPTHAERSLPAAARQQQARAEFAVSARVPAPLSRSQGEEDPTTWSPGQVAAWAAQLGFPVRRTAGMSTADWLSLAV